LKAAFTLLFFCSLLLLRPTFAVPGTTRSTTPRSGTKLSARTIELFCRSTCFPSSARRSLIKDC
jgi:hypothetical protein